MLPFSITDITDTLSLLLHIDAAAFAIDTLMILLRFAAAIVSPLPSPFLLR